MKPQISFTIPRAWLCLLILLHAACCGAATFTWNGSISTDWFNQTNWIPIGVPASADTINLTNGTTINFAGPVTLNGTFNWSHGTLSGSPLTIAGGGAMNITAGVALLNVLSNAGTVTVTGNGNVTIYDNNGIYQGGVYNLAGGLWDVQTNVSIFTASYGSEFFNNAGTFRKSGGPGTAGIYVAFSNAGTVTNFAGAINFYGGGALTGTYGTAAGASTYFAAGNFTMDAPPIITGPGLCEFTGTTLTLTQTAPSNLVLASGNVILGPAFQNFGAITNLTLNGAVLTSTNTVTGTFNWVNGAVASPLTIASGGAMNISGGVSLQNVLSNAGTVTVTGTGNVTIYNNNAIYKGGVYNLAGGLWDVQTNVAIFSAGYGFEFFNNAGVFRKSDGSATSSVYVTFSNGGLVTNLVGVINFGAGGTINGAYGTAAGASTLFAGGNFTMGAPPVITGSGLCEFTGATLTLTETVAPSLLLAGGNVILTPTFQNSGAITNLTLNGATLGSTNTVTGTFNWVSGTVASPLTVASGAALNIMGAVSLQNVLSNAGTVTITGPGNLTVFNNNAVYQGGIYNLAVGLWDIQTNASIFTASYGFEFFNNAGTVRKSGGPGTAAIYVPFGNNGLVTNVVGTISFSAGGAISGAYGTAAGASTLFAGGSFTMDAPPIITGAGLCEFTGTTLTLTQTVPPNLVLAGGSVILGPAFQNLGAITNLTLSGAVLTSTNTVSGTFNWASGTIAGPLMIANSAAMNITGPVNLQNVLSNAGTVTVTGNGSVTIYNNNAIYKGGVYNLPGGLWDIQTNASIFTASYGFEFFNNAGTFKKSGGPGTAAIYVIFTNSNSVTNLEGTISFYSGGTIAGTYGTGAGASTLFAGGNFTMDVPPVVAGSGLCAFTGATLTMTQNVPPNLVLAGGSVLLGPAFQDLGAITNLTLSGAALTTTNTVTGTFNWASGTIAGPMTVANGALVNITGATGLQNVFSNAGTVTMTGNASLTIYNNNAIYKGGVYNLAGGLWDIRTNASLFTASYGSEFFNNAGTFKKSGGPGTSGVYVAFSNGGTIDELVGVLGFYGSFTTSGGTLAFGVSGLSSFGQMNIPGAVALNGTASIAWLGGFTPAVGNSFALLTYGSHSGTFADISLPPGSLGQATYGATVFSLMITNVSAAPPSPVFLSVKLINPNNAIVLWPSSATNFTLQASSNLLSGTWSNVTTGIVIAGTNYVHTNDLNGREGFFRLQSH
jgi:hypothetical protein